MAGIEIVATGSAVPKNIITNDDLSKIVDTNDEWVSTRTGIRQRHFCEKNQANWQVAKEAASQAIELAMEKEGISKSDIGLLIVATFTPDYQTPSVACILQQELELDENIMAFDINAACSGFIYALNVTKSLLADNDNLKTKYALVIGSEKISTRLNMEDRGTCVLFGDGAGAAVVKLNENKKWAAVMGTKGNVDALGCPGHGMENPYVYMDGKEVFKNAVSKMSNVALEVLNKAHYDIEDIDYVVCHQANERIIKSVMKHLGGAQDKFYMNIARYGNTSAASIPIVLDEMNKKEMFKKGTKVLCIGFGAGFTWGGILLEF